MDQKDKLIIGEVKMKSPFGFISPYSWRYQFQIANAYCNMISIHTDSRWAGSFDDISKATSLTNKPILAKGIHTTNVEIERALKLGATKVLVVGRIPPTELLPYCFLEPNSIQELLQIPTTATTVWNSRDLETGQLKSESWAQARKVFSGTLIQASNIATISSMYPDANGYLIGEYLVSLSRSLYNNNSLL